VRIVIDTNVLISAIFWTGKPKQLLNHVRRRKITFVTSYELLDELRQILVRQDKPFHLQDNEADQVIEALRGFAEVVESRSQVTVCHDEMDNRVIACAIDGKAEYIVTGDLHLLGLRSYQSIEIRTVSDFLNHFERSF
jgi:putative PIN family toxin of toxin-antitoxin system